MNTKDKPKTIMIHVRIPEKIRDDVEEISYTKKHIQKKRNYSCQYIYSNLIAQGIVQLKEQIKSNKESF